MAEFVDIETLSDVSSSFPSPSWMQVSATGKVDITKLYQSSKFLTGMYPKILNTILNGLSKGKTYQEVDTLDSILVAIGKLAGNVDLIKGYTQEYKSPSGDTTEVVDIKNLQLLYISRGNAIVCNLSTLENIGDHAICVFNNRGPITFGVTGGTFPSSYIALEESTEDILASTKPLSTYRILEITKIDTYSYSVIGRVHKVSQLSKIEVPV